MSMPPRFDAAFAKDLDDLFRWRRDVRHFQLRAINDEVIGHLLDTACGAPSVGNSQPWRFVRLASAPLRREILSHVDEEVRRAGEIYEKGEQQEYARLKLHGLAQAPEWIVVYCDEASAAGHGLGRQTMPETLRYSTVMAIHTLWLAARARGLGLGWVSILNPTEIDRMLDAPPDWKFVALLCLGWPEKEDDVPELERTRWQHRLPSTQPRFTR